MGVSVGAPEVFDRQRAPSDRVEASVLVDVLNKRGPLVCVPVDRDHLPAPNAARSLSNAAMTMAQRPRGSGAGAGQHLAVQVQNRSSSSRQRTGSFMRSKVIRQHR